MPKVKVIKCKKINGQFFDSRHSSEDPMLISPLDPEISAKNLLHRLSILTVDSSEAYIRF